MARLNIAMLGEQAQSQTSSENLDLEALQLNETQADEDSTRAVIDESKDLSQSLGATTDTIDEMREVPDAAIKVAQEQLKYCIKRTGLNMSRVTTAMESKKGKEEIVKNLRLAKESLDKSISIAQEGLWDKIKNKFDRVFTSRRSLVKQIDVVSKKYDTKGQHEEVLVEKYLSVYLNPDNKSEASSADVVKVLQMLDKLYNGEEVIKTIEKMITIGGNIVDVVSKHNSNPAGDELSKIATFADQIKATKEKLDDIFNENEVSKTSEASLVTCAPEHKDKIISLCKSVLSDSAVERKMQDLLEKFERMYWATQNDVIRDREGNYVGQRPTDSVNSISGDVYDMIYDVTSITGHMEIMIFNVVHSAVRYIELSTKK